jgi:hypothetical protein
MTATLLSIVLTFILTGFLGNWLIQQWQQRNWMNQQRFLGEQKTFENLKALCDETMAISSRRLWKARRLAGALAHGDDALVRTRLNEYDQALSDWNERIVDFQVRLMLYGSSEMLDRFNSDIRDTFISISEVLDELTKQRQGGLGQTDSRMRQMQPRMNGLSGQLYNFNKDLNQMLDIQREKTFYGRLMTLDRANLESFKTWELVIALFKPRVTPLKVFRTPIDLGPPFGSRR